MSVLIGGSGSSGSSMLRTVINRHDDIFSGAELNFFNKEQIFLDWQKKKNLIFRTFPKISTYGWFPYYGTNLLHTDYGWEKNELLSLIDNSGTLNEFAMSFFEKSLNDNQSKLWVEKTPSNAYSFTHFLEMFTNGKVIHIVRDPLDAIYSLTKRGFSSWFATGIWVYNTISAEAANRSPRYKLVKYESLVSNPTQEIREICNFLGVSFQPKMVDSDVSNDGLRTWNNARTGKISKSSIGGFGSAADEVKAEILAALYHFRLKDKHIIAKNFNQTNAIEAANELGYSINLSRPKSEITRKIRLQNYQDQFDRLVRFASTKGSSYPAFIAS